ncbi:hypothetical protein DV738_g1300, partial [Chaetothyriales sp. CBS 135597]
MITAMLPLSHNDMDRYTPTAVCTNPSPSQLAIDLARKRAACDECRKRKLKCSGQDSGCTRCVKNGLACIYSEQKQMGRPKKRQKVNHDDSAGSSTSNPAIDPRLSTTGHERPDVPNIQPIHHTIPSSSLSSSSQSSATTPPSDNARTPTETDWYSLQFSSAFSPWPDFSRTDLSTPGATTVFEKEITTPEDVHSSSNDAPDCGFDLTVIPTPTAVPAPAPAPVPECTCLSNLYLALSTLSALSPFPPSSHTVTAVANAHRTARDVIYCAVCPRKYQTRSQNLMLGATLITSLIDHWKRISKSPATEIRAGFCTSSTSPCVQTEMTARQDLEWRTFIYYLMRYYVFGDHELPPLPDQPPEKAHSYLSSASTEQHITLVFLADAMERRQRVWHDMEPDTGEFPLAGTRETVLLYSGYTLEELKELDKCHSQGNGLVCIDLINYAKRCIRTLDTEVPRLA